MNPNQARLLIADDCESMREVTRDLMQELGFARVDAAADGQVALALFRSNHYDLVLTDWNMPFLTGIELLQRIRLGPSRSDTPVIVTSGNVTPERTNEAFNAGATAFFGKPFATVRLCEKVLRIIDSLNPVSDYVHAPHEERILQVASPMRAVVVVTRVAIARQATATSPAATEGSSATPASWARPATSGCAAAPARAAAPRAVAARAEERRAAEPAEE